MINFKNFYKRVNFDIDYYAEERFFVKQNDTKSRGFYVKIIQDGRVVKPSQYEKLTFYGRKPDGTDIFQDGVLDGGEFRIDLPNQAFTAPGDMRSEFSLRGPNGELISTKDFTITVIESFPMDPVESTDDFGALQSALAQIAGFAGELQDVQLFAESIKANLGELEDLDTDVKENVVAAINELNGKIDNVLDSEELETLLNAKVDKDTLGDISQLLTEEKEVIVNAINELFEDIEEIRSVSDIGDLLQLLNSKADKSTTGDIANLVDFEDEEIEINNLVEAVNYTYQLLIDSFASLGEINLESFALSEDLGDKEELTTEDKTNLVNAINEINAALKTVESVTDVEQLSILLSGKADKSSVGNLSELNTTQKNNLVAAINELNSIIDGLEDVDFTEIYNLLDDKVDQADFDNAISILQQNIDNVELTPGEGGSGGEANLGSHSSDEIIENYTNEYKAQVNVSENSSATAMGLELLINISESEVERWEPIDMRMLLGDLETDYLVDGAFIYAKVMDFGDFVDIRVEKKWRGEDMGMKLYPVKIMSAPSQVNASSGSEASGYRSQVNASRDSTASGELSQVNASRDSTASGSKSQVNASSGSEASGYRSQVNASMDSTASKYNSQVNASMDSTASGTFSQVNASRLSEASGYKSQVNASLRVLNNVDYSTAYGWGLSGDGDPQHGTVDRIKIHLLSKTGDINHSGVLNSGHNFTDYAELFPNLTGEAQGYGLIQTIDGHGVRPANSGDQIVGVTSATAGVVLGEASFSWTDRWLKDEWGAFIYHDVPDNDWEPDESKGETEDDRPMITVPKENPDYDPEREYVKRQERPDEWTVVGLIGQVYVRLKEDVEVMDYVKPWKDGVGQTSDEPTKLRVMKITQAFDADKGYKIGLCLLS